MSATGVTLLVARIPKAGPPRNLGRPGWEGSLLLPGLYLVGALLVGAVVIALVGRWRRAPRSGTADASAQLAEFRSLYEEGEMSQEEFDRVRALLGEEIRGKSGLPAGAAPPATPSVAAPPKPDPAATPPPGPDVNGTPPGGPPPDGTRPA